MTGDKLAAGPPYKSTALFDTLFVLFRESLERLIGILFSYFIYLNIEKFTLVSYRFKNNINIEIHYFTKFGLVKTFDTFFHCRVPGITTF